MYCDCCKQEKEDAKTYRLPQIGYGSFFDSLAEEDDTRFNLCSTCAKKINRWVKKKLPVGKTLGDFWACKQIEKSVINKYGATITYQEFEYEKILIGLFLKFMPEVIFGEEYLLEKIKCKLYLLLDRD